MKYLKLFNERDIDILENTNNILNYQEDIEDTLLYASDIFQMESYTISIFDRIKPSGNFNHEINIWRTSLQYSFMLEEMDRIKVLCHELERSSKLLNHINCEYGFDVVFGKDNGVHWKSNKNWDDYLNKTTSSSVIIKKLFCSNEEDLAQYNGVNVHLIKDISIFLDKLEFFDKNFKGDGYNDYNIIYINLYIW